MVNLNLRTNLRSGQVTTTGISARLCAIPLALALFGISSANAQAGGLSIISSQLGNINGTLQAKNPGLGVGAIQTIQPVVKTVVSPPAIQSPPVYQIQAVPTVTTNLVSKAIPAPVPLQNVMSGNIPLGGSPKSATKNEIGDFLVGSSFNGSPSDLIVSPPQGGYFNQGGNNNLVNNSSAMSLERGGDNNKLPPLSVESGHPQQGGGANVTNSDDQGKNSPSANSDNVAFSEIRPTGEEHAKGGSESADVEVAGGQPTGVTFLLVSGGKGAAQSADLGRNGAISGAAPDVFGVNYHVADVPQYVAGVSRSMYFCEDVFQHNTCLQAGRVAAR